MNGAAFEQLALISHYCLPSTSESVEIKIINRICTALWLCSFRGRLLGVSHCTVLWCYWLDDRKGTWPMKTSASKSRGMGVNVSGWI